MAPTFSLAFLEPHPSVHAPSSASSSTSQSRPILSGRGGAGNYTKHDPSALTHGATATGPAARASTISTTTSAPSQRRPFLSGIGGAGNARPASERRAFSFQDVLERRQQHQQSGPTVTFRVGRGGGGNTFVQSVHGAGGAVEGAGNADAASVSSAGSAGSGGVGGTRGAEKKKGSSEGWKGTVRRVFDRE